MKRMARLIMGVVILIVLLQNLPQIIRSLSDEISGTINTVANDVKDSVHNGINSAVNAIGDNIQNAFSGDQQELAEEKPTDGNVSSGFEVTKERIKEVQHKLNELGYNAGKEDGIWGSMTQQAVNAFQIQSNQAATKYLDEMTYLAICSKYESEAQSENDTVSGNCSHVWGEPYYVEEHPHNKVIPCRKCGYIYKTNDVRYFDDCCSCAGHLYAGEDYSHCLRCGKTAEQIEADFVNQNPDLGYYILCEHMKEVKYSEHPHIRAYYECTENGCPKYGVIIELDDQFRPDGRELSWCTECFPQDRIDNEHTLEMAKLSQQTYNMGTIIDNVSSLMTNGKYRSDDYSLFVEKTGRRGVYRVSGDVPINIDDPNSGTRFVNGLRITEQSDYPDGFIEVNNTADGELVVTVSFEGTQLEEFSDILTDIKTCINEDGIHRGFANVAKDYIYGIFNGSYYIDATINGVSRVYRISEIIGELQDNPRAHLRITGHSLGGAVAQCLAYYLIKGDLYKISSDQIEVYTYASPIPFTYESIEADEFRNMNIYNFINVNDIVPDIGVSISDGIITRIAEEGGALVANKFKNDGINGGASIAGTNLGTNIYLSSDDLANWNASNHNMQETYLPLIEGYVNGSIPSYVFDTDIFFSEYYDLSAHKALASTVDIGEKIVKTLRIGKYSIKAGSIAYDLLDGLGMLD